MPEQITDAQLYESARGWLSPAEETAIRAWRARALENERRYQAAARIAQLTDRADALIDPGVVPVAKELVWRAEAKLALRDGLRRSSAARRRWWLAGAAAAAVALIAVLILRVRTELRGDGFGADDFITGKAELATVRLRDGSVVNARLDFPFWRPNPGERGVYQISSERALRLGWNRRPFEETALDYLQWMYEEALNPASAGRPGWTDPLTSARETAILRAWDAQRQS